MSTNFEQGQTLKQGDLTLFLTDTSGNPENAYSIFYAVYFVDPATGAETLIGTANRTPVNPSVGEYYASLLIPSNAEVGCYRIRWRFKERSNSQEEGVVQQFGVIGPNAVTNDIYTPCVRNLINKMRVLTRDNNPARNYKFMPPEGEGKVGCYNQVFGYIWEDAEFVEYMEIALWKWNMHPPNTEGMYPNIERLCQQRPSWQAAILWGALVNAAQALVYNWISQEFSVAGETLVTVYLPDGQEVSLPIAELHQICKGEDFDHPILSAFNSGKLKTLAVDPETGTLGLHPIKDVMMHHTGDRPSVTVTSEDGRSVTTTCDHSLFQVQGKGIQPIRADELQSGDAIAEVRQESLCSSSVIVSVGKPLETSYDLCVPGPENFVLTNGFIAHNSYSIGGISLDLEKSSKYEGMKSNAEEQWDKLVEAKSRTEKYLRGLSQPRFGRGVRSAFGPQVGRGVLSPRNFLVGLVAMSGAACYTSIEVTLSHAYSLSTLFT